MGRVKTVFIFVVLITLGTTLQKAYAQEVTGGVFDANSGKTMPGVNIAVKGTTIGTASDAKGQFQLKVPSQSDTLIFSFVGYQTQEIPIQKRTEIDVFLQPQTISGEEMVVIGYGEQKEITTTGSISQISGDKIAEVPTMNIGNALTGKVSGLTTIQTTGQPGISDPEIYLRGVSTFNNQTPLVVIDGIPNSISTLQQMDPSSVRNISVLKDASATAVYGVRGANGVIIVTTKRGKTGDIKISASVSGGFQVPQDNINFADGYEIVKAYNQAQINDGNPSLALPNELVEAMRTGSKPLIYPNQRWWKRMIKNEAFQTRNNIHVSGGTQSARYYISLGYAKKSGILNTDVVGGPGKIHNFKSNRFNPTANIDLDITPTTQIKLSSKAHIKERREPVSGGINYHDFWGRILQHSAPFSTVGVQDGKYIQANRDYFPFLIEDSQLDKVYGTGYRDINSNEFDLNLEFTQKLYKGLELNIKGDYRSGFNRNQDYYKGNAYYTPIYKTDVHNINRVSDDSTVVLQQNGSTLSTGSWSGDYSVSRYLYWQADFRYTQNFGKHNFNALLLYNQSKEYYPTGAYPNIPTGYVGSAARLEYNYNQKYLLEFNMGYNGSENFAENRRFGFFPAVSAGWVASGEKFLGNISFLSHLKLKASLGKVGNDKIGGGRFLYLPSTYDRTSWYLQGYNFGVNKSTIEEGTRVGTIGNPNLTWEAAIKKNFGVETRFFNDKLSFNFDYFTQLRKNILMRRNTVPGFVTAPLSLPPYNLGKIRNHGYEVELGWGDTKGDFSYQISANWSFAKNKIEYMDEIPPNEPYLAQTGRPIGTHFGYIVKGFYNKDNIGSSDIPKNKFLSNPKPGDVIYKDLNGDGIINNNDRKSIGYPRIPQVNFGTQINLSYSGFNFRMNWQGVTQVSKSIGGAFRRPVLKEGRGVLQDPLDKAWTPERAKNGVKNLRPRLSIGGNGSSNYMSSTMWVRNASYIRLKEAELGYTFSNKAMQRIGLRNLRVYLNGYNLLTLKHSEYKTMDPEKNAEGDSNHYPIMKIFNLGFDIKF